MSKIELFSEDDLADLFQELEEAKADEPEEILDKEMDASQKRYLEIIRKHKSE